MAARMRCGSLSPVRMTLVDGRMERTRRNNARPSKPLLPCPANTRSIGPVRSTWSASLLPDGRQMRFDYQLRKGPCTSRNAIKLLALAGYPKDVIEAAEKLATFADRGLSPILPTDPGELVPS